MPSQNIEFVSIFGHKSPKFIDGNVREYHRHRFQNVIVKFEIGNEIECSVIGLAVERQSSDIEINIIMEKKT